MDNRPADLWLVSLEPELWGIVQALKRAFPYQQPRASFQAHLGERLRTMARARTLPAPVTPHTRSVPRPVWVGAAAVASVAGAAFVIWRRPWSSRSSHLKSA